MRKLKARKVSRFRMPEADLLRWCWDYSVNKTRNDDAANEIYAIIDANLKHFNIEQIHGRAAFEELRQTCMLKILTYTIDKMMTAVSKSGKINAHSYIFQAAYNEVGQYIRKFERRTAMRFYQDEITELLGELVFADGEPTIVKGERDG